MLSRSVRVLRPSDSSVTFIATGVLRASDTWCNRHMPRLLCSATNTASPYVYYTIPYRFLSSVLLIKNTFSFLCDLHKVGGFVYGFCYFSVQSVEIARLRWMRGRTRSVRLLRGITPPAGGYPSSVSRQAFDSCLAAARSRSRSDTTPWCHSLRSRRFATPSPLPFYVV